MYFTPTSGNTGGNSSSRLRSLASATTPANQTCIALQGGGWTASICTPVTLTDPATNQAYIKCECQNLCPTTVVNDLGNLFGNSNLVKAFSGAGLAAFLDFDYAGSAVTYIFALTTFGCFYCIYWGWNADLFYLQSIKEEKHRRIILAEIAEFLKQQRRDSVKSKQNGSQIQVLPPPQIGNDRLSHSRISGASAAVAAAVIPAPIQAQQLRAAPEEVQKQPQSEIQIEFKSSQQFLMPNEQQQANDEVKGQSDNNRLDILQSNQASNSVLSIEDEEKPHENLAHRNSVISKSIKNMAAIHNRAGTISAISTPAGGPNVQHNFTDAQGAIPNIRQANSNFYQGPMDPSPASARHHQAQDSDQLIIFRESHEELQDDAPIPVQQQRSLQEQPRSRQEQPHSRQEQPLSRQEQQPQELKSRASLSISRQSEYLNTEEEKQLEKKVEERRQQSLRTAKVTNSVVKLHEFVSIYYYFLPTQPRPLRYMFYYMKTIYVMAVTASLAQQTNILESILLSVVISVFAIIPKVITQTLMTSPYLAMRIGGIVFFVVLTGFSFYLLIASLGLMGFDLATAWTEQYILGIIHSESFVAVVVLIVMVVIINYAIDNDNKIAGILYENLLCSNELFLTHYTRGRPILTPQLKKKLEAEEAANQQAGDQPGGAEVQDNQEANGNAIAIDIPKKEPAKLLNE